MTKFPFSTFHAMTAVRNWLYRSQSVGPNSKHRFRDRGIKTTWKLQQHGTRGVGRFRFDPAMKPQSEFEKL